MNRIVHAIANLIYTIIIVVLLYIALSVVWQSIKEPDKIPNIFGYKLFMILDKDMQHVEYGDLVFTKNIGEKDLEKGDIVAFRDIKENKVQIIRYSRKIPTDNIEGLLIKRIPKIGAILYIIQQPLVMSIIIAIILVIGGICIYIAGKLDEREMKNSVTNDS